MKRLWIAGLLALLVVAGCEEDFTWSHFTWQGQNWRIRWKKEGRRLLDTKIITPDGKFLDPEDPSLPFRPMFTDGVIHIPGGTFAGPGSHSALEEGPAYLVLMEEEEYNLLVWNTASLTLESVIPIVANPQRMAISHDGSRIAVTHQALNEFEPGGPAPPSLTLVDFAIRAVVGRVDLAADADPLGVVFSADDTLIYIAEQGFLGQTPSILVHDAATGQHVDTIALPAAPHELVISPDGQMLYASGGRGLLAIDTTTLTVVADILAGMQGTEQLLTDYTGARVFGMGFGRVAVVDTATATELKRINIPQSQFQPRLNRMALSLDGGSLFVNDQNATFVTRIDLRSLEVAETIPVDDELADTSLLFIAP